MGIKVKKYNLVVKHYSNRTPDEEVVLKSVAYDVAKFRMLKLLFEMYSEQAKDVPDPDPNNPIVSFGNYSATISNNTTATDFVITEDRDPPKEFTVDVHFDHATTVTVKAESPEAAKKMVEAMVESGKISTDNAIPTGNYVLDVFQFDAEVLKKDLNARFGIPSDFLDYAFNNAKRGKNED